MKREDNIGIVYHADPDGVCSAAILAKAIKAIRKKEVDSLFYASNYAILKNILQDMQDYRFNKLIFLDMSVDQISEIKKTEQFSDILVLDHHKLYKDINSKKTTLIKPQMVFSRVNSDFYCCSKLSYDLVNNVIDLSCLDWIAVIGILGDSCFEYWKPFVNKVLKKYGINKKPDIYKSQLGKAAELIFYSIAHNIKNANICYNLLYNSKDYKDIVNSKIKRYGKEIQNEVDYWNSNVNQLAEKYPDLELIIDFIKPRYFINPAVIRYISIRNPDKTIIIAQDMNLDTLHISGRRADSKIAVNALLEKSIENLQGANAGGHESAAAATIRKQDFFRFKNNIIRILSNNLSLN